ncbi:hypothetical protein evm_006186 [Chilo suppressalis]|nr:hypothetical protein evm_006186 [Chilo suppressalis]
MRTGFDVHCDHSLWPYTERKLEADQRLLVLVLTGNRLKNFYGPALISADKCWHRSLKLMNNLASICFLYYPSGSGGLEAPDGKEIPPVGKCHPPTSREADSSIMQEVLLLIIPKIVFTYGCWGYTEDMDKEKVAAAAVASMLNPNNKEIWNGWDPPPGVNESWVEWFQEFQENTRGKTGYLTEEQKKDGVLPAGHDVPGWPADWNGLGEGYGGMAPPPWAYVPKNLGKPPQCYDPPVSGHCTEEIMRFGYNPFMDECQAFVYSGCGGNRNNFLTAEQCEGECINPVMGCDPDSGIPVS